MGRRSLKLNSLLERFFEVILQDLGAEKLLMEKFLEKIFLSDLKNLNAKVHVENFLEVISKLSGLKFLLEIFFRLILDVSALKSFLEKLFEGVQKVSVLIFGWKNF